MKLPSHSVRITTLLVIIVLAGAVLAWWQPWRQQTSNNTTLYGNVDIREVQLAFRVGGRLESMIAEEGDTVTAGTELAHLDAQPLREALAVIEANVARAQANLDRINSGARPQEISQAQSRVREAESAAATARRESIRQQSLLETRSTSQTVSDRAAAIRDQTAAQLSSAQEALTLIEEGARAEDIAAATASLLATKAQLVQAQSQIDDTTLYAPAQGIISIRAREPGSLLAAGQPVYALTLTDKVFVRAYVSETSLGSVVPGMMVGITTDSSEKTYQGRIGFVSPRAEFTPKSVQTPALRTDLVYRLRIIVVDADTQLRQGMPVTLHLPTLENDSAQ